MKKPMLLTFVVAFGWLSVMGLPRVCQAAEVQLTFRTPLEAIDIFSQEHF